MSDFISPVILDRVPSYIKDQYPVYTQFLTDYISFLEQDSGFLQILNDWKNNVEPSNNVAPYIDMILADCGMQIQQPIVVPKSTLLFFLRDFMLSRGSQQSFVMLFKLLFGAVASVDYPRDRMFVPSAALYGETDYIFTKTDVWYGTSQFQFVIDNVASFGGTATGSSSGVTASIQSIQVIGYSEGFYLQIEILKPLKEFLSTDLITINVNGNIISEAILSVVVPTIVTSGYGYAVDDKVIVQGALIDGRMVVGHTSSGGITGVSIIGGGCGYSVGNTITANTGTLGSGFAGHVSTVDPAGSITGVVVDTAGYNYNTLPSLRIHQTTTPACLANIQPNSTEIGQIKNVRTIVPYLVETAGTSTVVAQSTSGSGATFSVALQTRFTVNAWENQAGFIGYNTVIQDSYKYQTYSYRLLSPIDPSLYTALVTSLLHPAGVVKSFVVVIDGQSTTSMNLSSSFGLTSPVLLIDYGTTVTYTLSTFSIITQVA